MHKVQKGGQTVNWKPSLKETDHEIDLKLLSDISEQNYGSLTVSQFSCTY